MTGDVFTPTTDDELIDSLINGTLEVPLPTYFTLGTHPLPERLAAKVAADEEICPNLHFLGKRSINKTSDGLRIVALGGLLDTNLVGGQSKEQHLPFHTEDDAKALRGANSADILLTSIWPADVWHGSKVPLEPSQQASIQSTKSIAELCAALKPRYHLSASQGAFFYEREPFLHPSQGDSDVNNVTRFISMAPYGNEAKAKAMYAFSLNKSDTVRTWALLVLLSPLTRISERETTTRTVDLAAVTTTATDMAGATSDGGRPRRPAQTDATFACQTPTSRHTCAAVSATSRTSPLPRDRCLPQQRLRSRA